MTVFKGFGAVVFAKDIERLARFYEAVVPMHRRHADVDHIVLGAGGYELVIHGIPRHIADGILIEDPPKPREDTPLKLFFVVASLAQARVQAASLGGRLLPADREWSVRGFRACDGVDPEGNVLQCREAEVSTP